MIRDDVCNAIKSSILKVFPDWGNHAINEENSLKYLGANSIDRAEIIMLTMAHLELKIPMINFAKAQNIGELIDIFYMHVGDNLSI